MYILLLNVHGTTNRGIEIHTAELYARKPTRVQEINKKMKNLKSPAIDISVELIKAGGMALCK